MDEFKVALTELAEDDEDREMAEDSQTMEMLMTLLDEDGDRMLTCDELLKILELENEDDDEVERVLMIKMIKDADKDGDGFLTATELKDFFLKWDPEDVADIDKNVDMFIKMASIDGDKKLKIEEAIKLLTSEADEYPQEKMKIMFRMCDCDGDGSISKKELAKFMKIFSDDDDESPAEFKEMINTMMVIADEDGDGKLSYDEFCNLMVSFSDSD